MGDVVDVVGGVRCRQNKGHRGAGGGDGERPFLSEVARRHFRNICHLPLFVSRQSSARVVGCPTTTGHFTTTRVHSRGRLMESVSKVFRSGDVCNLLVYLRTAHIVALVLVCLSLVLGIEARSPRQVPLPHSAYLYRGHDSLLVVNRHLALDERVVCCFLETRLYFSPHAMSVVPASSAHD